ncbi:MAG: Crp/Fnr family transcriptional regulator [Rhodospirillales bacterium]|nr:Crp/Fnr family transcriptional regulator [Rhodospirillales bacterium]
MAAKTSNTLEPGWAGSPFQGKGGADFWARHLGLAKRRSMAKGQIIFSQGDVCDRFYYLESGRVKMYLTGAKGGTRVISLIEAGNTFGESACFDGLPAYLSAAALSPCTLHVFPRPAVLKAMAADPAMLREALRVLVRRQRILATQIEAAAFLKGPARLALLLCHLAATAGVKRSNGETEIRPGASLEDIASLFGLSRVTASRELNALIRKGIVRREGRTLVIGDERALWARLSREDF